MTVVGKLLDGNSALMAKVLVVDANEDTLPPDDRPKAKPLYVAPPKPEEKKRVRKAKPVPERELVGSL